MNGWWIVVLPTGVVEDLVPRADNIFSKAPVMSPCLPLPLVKVAVLTRTPCTHNNSTILRWLSSRVRDERALAQIKIQLFRLCIFTGKRYIYMENIITFVRSSVECLVQWLLTRGEKQAKEQDALLLRKLHVITT